MVGCPFPLSGCLLQAAPGESKGAFSLRVNDTCSVTKRYCGPLFGVSSSTGVALEGCSSGSDLLIDASFFFFFFLVFTSFWLLWSLIFWQGYFDNTQQ